MGEVKTKTAKPLQINPLKLSAPMGATLAFLGIDRCMPLMHGAQGCTSFTKVFFTRHFSEPIAIQTTAVSDVTAILDGGDDNIVEAIRNITQKVTPELIGLYTTGLPETKGDDIRRIAAQVDFPLVAVNTPDYEGGLESGWALSARAIIEQLVETTETINDDRVLLLPHVSLSALEVEKIKDFIADFGFDVLALPDLSTSLDGHLGEKQAALSSGGIATKEIRTLAESNLVITVGDSMCGCAAALLAKNPFVRHHHFSHLQGLEASDRLAALLLKESGRDRPSTRISRWRQRLQDAMLDSHFSLGQTDFLVTGEPDQVAGISQALSEVGGRIKAVITTVNSTQLPTIAAGQVLVGDLEDAEKLADDYDLIIGNGHCEALAHRLDKGLVLRGYPNWERVGHQLRTDVLYEGGCQLLFEAANVATVWREQNMAREKQRPSR